LGAVRARHCADTLLSSSLIGQWFTESGSVFAAYGYGGGKVPTIDKGDSHILQDPGWRLLAEFAASDEPGSEQRLAEPVASAVQELGLQPAQVHRIRQAVQEAVDKAVQHRNPEKQNPPIFIRVWISGVSTPNARKSTSGARRDDEKARLAWGFFMVEKRHDAAQATGVAKPSVIELFLYQERFRPKGKHE
jgi:hypothetical protein